MRPFIHFVWQRYNRTTTRHKPRARVFKLLFQPFLPGRKPSRRRKRISPPPQSWHSGQPAGKPISVSHPAVQGNPVNTGLRHQGDDIPLVKEIRYRRGYDKKTAHHDQRHCDWCFHIQERYLYGTCGQAVLWPFPTQRRMAKIGCVKNSLGGTLIINGLYGNGKNSVRGSRSNLLAF